MSDKAQMLTSMNEIRSRLQWIFKENDIGSMKPKLSTKLKSKLKNTKGLTHRKKSEEKGLEYLLNMPKKKKYYDSTRKIGNEHIIAENRTSRTRVLLRNLNWRRSSLPKSKMSIQIRKASLPGSPVRADPKRDGPKSYRSHGYYASRIRALENRISSQEKLITSVIDVFSASQAKYIKLKLNNGQS